MIIYLRDKIIYLPIISDLVNKSIISIILNWIDENVRKE